mmetsp:Transcript_12134/g.35630  ORF Transcript_12134/g.35630 Transcript_12134/m.35630 type:complete len:214 (+) Transcript_12134:1210-1851(+)
MPTGARRRRSNSPCPSARPWPRPCTPPVVRMRVSPCPCFSRRSSRRPDAPTATLRCRRPPPKSISLDATSGSHSCARPDLPKRVPMYPANSRRPSWARPSPRAPAPSPAARAAPNHHQTGKSDRRRRARRPRRGPARAARPTRRRPQPGRTTRRASRRGRRPNPPRCARRSALSLLLLVVRRRGAASSGPPAARRADLWAGLELSSCFWSSML